MHGGPAGYPLVLGFWGGEGAQCAFLLYVLGFKSPKVTRSVGGATARRATLGQCAAMVMAGMLHGDAAAPDLMAYSPFLIGI